MTATTLRWDIIQAVVAVLRTIDATGDYTENLSGTARATDGFETREQRQQQRYTATARVEEGTERVDHPELTSELEDTFLEIIVDFMVKGRSVDTSTTLRAKLNKGLGDINLAIGRNKTLGGKVVWIAKAAVDEPAYDFDQRIGSVKVRFIVRYYNVAGTTI